MAEIRERGSLSFPEYLGRVLYDPQAGYYASGRARIGWQGDFFTNVSVGAVYGKILAQWVVRVWEEGGRPDEFVVMEQGVHEGVLTRDLRREFRQRPDFWASLRHVIIEPSARLQEMQAALLGDEAREISWQDDLPLRKPAAAGVHLSNELLDAFPFHVVEWDGQRWEELRVGVEEEGQSGAHLVWERKLPGERLLCEALERLPANLPVGYRTEVRTNFPAWLEKIGVSFARGRILICDYGYPRELYYLPERSRGTLYCYHGHQRDEDPLVQPGEKDISAHVDFSAVMEAGEAFGWEVRSFMDQHHFLTRAAAPWLRSLDSSTHESGPSRETQLLLRQLQMLLHPETMGRQFHFLELARG
jgi:SAM-dependent MidA family methyltransferase